MAIQMYVIHVDGQDLSCPIVECDHCGEPIKDAGDGNYEWQGGSGEPGPDGLVFFTHKRCCYSFEEKRGGFWLTGELNVFPLYLMNNLKTTYEKMVEHAKCFASY